MFWLSFADPNLPAGSQFLGVVIVPLDDFELAVAWTHFLGLNPGGEVMGYPIPPGYEHQIDPADVGRLLSKTEAAKYG